MSKIRISDLSDGELVERGLARSLTRTGLHKAGKRRISERALVDEQAQRGELEPVASDAVFAPTFNSSRHERVWILSYLGPFYDEGYLTDVLFQVRGGKEATVYCCKAHPDTGLDLLAAKVYRPRPFRKLRNDSQYRQGRGILDGYGKQVHDERYLVAVRKKTNVGKELIHTSWLQHEYQTMEKLWDAGADVPRPIAHGSNTILMEYLGEMDAPAPTLNRVRLPARQVRPVFDRLVHNLELMLSLNRIHADLSAYNVLYWDDRITLIDFPQTIDPRENRDAYPIFLRDVTRLCEYFERYRLTIHPEKLARGLWDRYIHSDLASLELQQALEDQPEE